MKWKAPCKQKLLFFLFFTFPLFQYSLFLLFLKHVYIKVLLLCICLSCHITQPNYLMLQLPENSTNIFMKYDYNFQTTMYLYDFLLEEYRNWNASNLVYPSTNLSTDLWDKNIFQEYYITSFTNSLSNNWICLFVFYFFSILNLRNYAYF